MQIKQMKEHIMIVSNLRGYSTTIKKRTPFECKCELFNAEDNHFIIVYSANDKGLSKLEINKNIYESIEKNAYKNN